MIIIPLRKAVMNFQTKNNSKADGLVGGATMAGYLTDSNGDNTFYRLIKALDNMGLLK